MSWLLSISFRDILSIASSMSIHLRISVLADFPTHTYLSPGLPDGFLLSLKAALCMTAVGQFLGLLLGSLSENICVCSGKVMADHCNCCLGLQKLKCIYLISGSPAAVYRMSSCALLALWNFYYAFQ